MIEESCFFLFIFLFQSLLFHTEIKFLNGKVNKQKKKKNAHI